MQHFDISANTASGYQAMARELRRNRRYDEATEVLHEGVKRFPNDPDLLNAYGRRLSAKGQYEEALDHFERAHLARPEDAYIACDYAELLAKRGKTEEAEIIYLRAFDDEAVDFSRGNQLVLNGLGNLYENTQRYQFAAICYAEACKCDPEDADAHRNYFRVASQNSVKTDDHAEQWETFLEYAQGLIEAAAELAEAKPNPAP